MPLSAEDLQARLGKLTASRMKDALDFKRNGESGANRIKLMQELVAERMTGVFVPHYVTPAMQHGIDTEPEALEAVAEKLDYQLKPGSFVDHPTIEFLGATPDAFIWGHRGLVEIKCPTTTQFISWVRAGSVPSDHIPQMCVQLACTGYEFCTFAAYDPRMPEGRRLFIRRYTPTAEELAKVEAAAVQFLDETEALFRAVTEAEMT